MVGYKHKYRGLKVPKVTKKFLLDSDQFPIQLMNDEIFYVSAHSKNEWWIEKNHTVYDMQLGK